MSKLDPNADLNIINKEFGKDLKMMLWKVK